MSPLLYIAITVISLIAVGMIAGGQYGRTKNPQVGVFDGFMFLVGFLYSKIIHKAEFVVEEGVFEDIDGPMIVVCNHTCGIDPFLVSSVVPRRVCWLMAEDMRIHWLAWFWNWAGVIFVDRNRQGKSGIRKARLHLKEGGMIGIFPEGKIERPAKKLLPFAPGVGVLVKLTGARVLPVIIEGTPHVPTAWDSIWTSSNAHIRVMKPIDYSESGLCSAEIAADLQQRFQDWTGWELGSRKQPHAVETDESELDDTSHAIGDATRQIA